jgi:histidine triad (HIT) family protein
MKCVFCDFIEGRIKEHRKGYPFIVHNESEHALSFLSLDSPVNKEPHFLVIPKKHHQKLHDMPLEELEDLINQASLLGKFLASKKKDYNLLNNNGYAAGQRVPHVHFHLIPRKKNDSIKIEVWQHEQASPKDFVELSQKTKQEFKAWLKK